MLRPKGWTLAIAMGVVTVILCLPTKSYAWLGISWGTGHGHGHGHERGWSNHHYAHPYFGLHVSALPQSCYDVWSGGSRYHYCDGYYYRRDRTDYIVVNPPVGTVLSTVPVTYQPVIINGTTYYTNNGVYYIYTSSGYQVVPTPVVDQTRILQTLPAPAQTVEPAAAQASTQVTATADDYFTINIPNEKGGYHQVTIKRSGNGFVGPQGEFYSTFPSVTQLKAMYVK